MARPFAWGEWDCNLFLIELLDVLWPTEEPRVNQIRGKYNSRLGAAKFQRTFTPAPKFFQEQGLELLSCDSSDFRELDIIFKPEQAYWSMSLYFAGQTWAVIEDRTMMVNVVEPGEYLIARSNG